MAYIDWPKELPAPTQKGYNYQPGEPFYKSEFQHSTRYRKRYRPTNYVDVQFLFTREEMQRFSRFFYDDLKHAVEWFNADWEIDGDTATVKEYHFASAYKATLKDSRYTVTVKCEIRNSATGASL